MMTRLPPTLAECDEMIARVKIAMGQCACSEHALIWIYADDLVILESRRAELAAVPPPRSPPDASVDTES